MVVILIMIFLVSIGTVVHKTSFGSTGALNTMFEPENEEGYNEQEWLMIEKKRWARFLYCFSIPKNWWSVFHKAEKESPEVKFINGLLVFGCASFILHTAYYFCVTNGTLNTEYTEFFEQSYLTFLFYPIMTV